LFEFGLGKEAGFPFPVSLLYLEFFVFPNKFANEACLEFDYYDTLSASYHR